MKIAEFKKPAPDLIPEPTFEEKLHAEFEDFGKPKAVPKPPVPIVEVNELEEEIRTQFEASYAGNIGAMEVMQFYRDAPPKYITLLKRLIAADKNKEAWKLIQKITGTKLQGQQFNENGGRIVKNVNTTQDVDVDEIKVQAKKMGFDVTIDGVPPLMTADGKLKKTIKESFNGTQHLDEFNMAPGRLQKEVNRIIQSANPIIGIEFEVIIPRDEESNPDITYYTTLDDIKEFFTFNEAAEDFSDLANQYQEWLDNKQAEWADDRVKEILNNPSEEWDKKKEFMVDAYTLNDDVINALQRSENLDETDDVEITDDIATDILDKAYKLYKTKGNADTWPAWQTGTNPYIIIYQVIFGEDPEEAEEFFKEDVLDEFYDYELNSSNHKYSVGVYLKENHLNSMGDVFREYGDTLYWPGGPLDGGDFDETTAYQVASEIEDIVGEDVSVEGGDSYGDVDTSENWVITSDPSIRPDGDDDAGLEIITPKMQYVNGIDTLEEVFGYFERKGAYTNDTTGLHINVSLGKIDQSKLNYTKLVVMLGDSHILKQYGREFNEYAENSLTRLAAMMDVTQGFRRDQYDKAKAYADMMAKMKSDFNNAVASAFDKIDFGKFSSVGIKDGYIEFRSAGGSNYLDNVDQIIAHINRFVVAYAVAADPDAYKKEYGKKLYKLASNVSKEQEPTTSMVLFAKFNAGMLTKEELIRHLKAKQSAKQAEKEPVDDGLSYVPVNRRDAMQVIADKYNLNDNIVEITWMEAEEIEHNNGAGGHDETTKRVFKNLMSDIRYYDK